MTLLILFAVALLVSLGQNILASYDWTAETVVAAFVTALMLLTRRL